MGEHNLFQPQVYKRLPRFLSEIRDNAKERNLPQAIYHAFKSANISVEVRGDKSNWQRPREAALFVGGVHRGFERYVLMSILGELGRNDILFVAKPYAFSAALTRSLDPNGMVYTLPVVPSSLANDKKPKISRDLYIRLRYMRSLPASEEIKERNNAVLQEASSRLEQGFIVNIFPRGRVEKKHKADWLIGIGRIAAAIPFEKRSTIAVVNYDVRSYSFWSLLFSLWLRKRGILPPLKKITLTLGEKKSLADVIGAETDPYKITQLLQKAFDEDFPSH